MCNGITINRFKMISNLQFISKKRTLKKGEKNPPLKLKSYVAIVEKTIFN
jgi:hypothetical protein